MKEQELRNTIKIGIKPPSNDFTNKVMGEISTSHNEILTKNKWNIRILFSACCILFVLSIFVRLPGIEFFNYAIEFSPVIIPIVSLIFLFVVLQQLYDMRNRISDYRNKMVVRHWV